MSKEPRIAKLLEKLNSNIDVLTKVTALTFRKESLFKGTETTPEQIKILEEMKLPDNIIALIIGSTVNSVRAQRSQRKAKEKKLARKEEQVASEGAEKGE